MPLYQEMPEEEVLAILRAHAGQDVLTGMQKTEDAFLRQIVCPRCGGSTTKCYSNDKTVFSNIVAQLNLKCTLCEAEFSPRTGVITKLGNLGRAAELALAQQTPWVMPSDDED